jgi:type I restriction enzyme M protein
MPESVQGELLPEEAPAAPNGTDAPRRRGRQPKAAAPPPEKLEVTLFKAADKLRGAMDPGEYKHVALGLVFLRYISAAFEHARVQIVATPHADPEDVEEYRALGAFWVPPEARWPTLQAAAREPRIGEVVDTAMRALEDANPATLRGALPKDYARPALPKAALGQLVDQFTNLPLTGERSDFDLLGRVYEYFLGGFAGKEGKRGGDFYTPPSVVRLMVDILQPRSGRVYDPCCGTGGFFVQSETFLEAHQGRIGDIAVYGQERNHTTWRLARMNLAIRGISAEVAWNDDGTLKRDALPDLRADTVLANPPFNISEWDGASLAKDARWHFGTPPVGNANFAWLQHCWHHLAPGGRAGVVLANGSLSSTQGGEDVIRRAMVEAGVVEGIVALPAQMFYGTGIPACLWFLRRQPDARREVLFVDARKLGFMETSTFRAFTAEEIARVADTFTAWRKGEGYADVPGFCRAADEAAIREHGFVLTPGRYVGAAETADDSASFADHFAELRKTLEQQFEEGEKLKAAIRDGLQKLAL